MKLLFIRSKHDHFTRKSFEAAQKIIDNLNNPNISYLDLKERDAIKRKVEDALNNNPIDLVIHYGHGAKDALLGHRSERLIDLTNVNQLLKDKGVKTSTVSCESASQLGPATINSAETNAYLGYKDPIAFPDRKSPFIDLFYEAYNQPNLELLIGKTFQEAYNQGKTTFSDKYQEIYNNNDPNIDPRVKAFALMYMKWAFDALELCGNGNATV